MSLVIAADFITKYDFEPLSNELDKVQQILDESEQDCPAEIWGAKQIRGIENLAAHRLTMRWLQAGATASSAVSAAKGSTQSLPTGEDLGMGATQYGREYMRLSKGLAVCGFVL